MKLDLEWAFTSYSDAFLQDMLTVLESLQREGTSISEIITFGRKKFSEKRTIQYEAIKRTEQMRKEFYSKLRRCALCGSPMNLDAVNDTNCTQVGGQFKSMWSCVYKIECGETAYSDLPIHEEAARYGLEQFYPDPEKVKSAMDEGNRRRSRGNRLRTTSQQKPVPKPCGGRRR